MFAGAVFGRMETLQVLPGAKLFVSALTTYCTKFLPKVGVGWVLYGLEID